MLTAFVMIEAQAQRIAEVAQAIANLPQVSEVYSVTGDHDIVAIVRVADYDELAVAVPEGISRIEGVLRTTSMVAFRRFSAKDLQAAWDLGLS